jgi:peroxiredoxin family protein
LGFTAKTDEVGPAEWRITLARETLKITADVSLNKARVTIILHSSSYDRASYALSLAMTALTMDAEVYMFLTYGGLRRFTKSCFESLGEETDAELRDVMTRGLKSGVIKPLAEQLTEAKKLGIKIYACSGIMAHMNIARSELRPEVDEVTGSSTFLNLARKAVINWYI